MSNREVTQQFTAKLLPDVLKELWQAVEENRFTREQFCDEQERLFDEYRNNWAEALTLGGFHDLKESLLRELASYVGCQDLAEIERRCSVGWRDVEDEWHKRVESGSSESVQRFYDQTEAYLYNLIWWHTLCEDDAPLAYVLALRFARNRECRPVPGLRRWRELGHYSLRPSRLRQRLGRHQLIAAAIQRLAFRPAGLERSNHRPETPVASKQGLRFCDSHGCCSNTWSIRMRLWTRSPKR